MIDLKGMTNEELTAKRGEMQNRAAQWSRGTMGDKAAARGAVRLINKELRLRGAMPGEKPAAERDTSGFVAAAVAPLKADAQERAREHATTNYWRLFRLIEAAGWDLDRIAPYPSTNMGKAEYATAKARRALYSALFARDAAASRAVYSANLDAWRADNSVKLISGGEGAVSIVKADDARRDRYIAEEVEQTGLSFDAYVAKLEGKVGAGVTGATVTGNLWGGSVLTVWKGEAQERWHTQQIINVSVLGKLFNQWPTRRMK